jgi:hypothetical protein
MFDPNKNQPQINSLKFLKYFKKLLNIATEIMLLIAFTVFAYICLLYFVKYLWVIFTSTEVGQAYARIYAENYRITNDVLNRNFISLAINLTLTSYVICFIAGAIFKFLYLIRLFYSGRGFFIRFIFTGLPLSFIVATYIHYVGDFSHMDTAYAVAFVPTLCVFTGCFRFAEEFVPTLFDLIYVFNGKHGIIRSNWKEEEVRSGPDVSIKKVDAKQNGTVRKKVLQEIWESFEAYITVILIIIFVVGILLIIPKIQNFTRTEVPETRILVDTTPEQKPAPVEEVNTNERFRAYPGKTVLDTKTRLMWAAQESETLSWHDAKMFCKKYHGGGYKDWRMPTIAELDGLYDSSKQPDCGSVTHLIEMDNDTCWEWSSQTKDSDAAFFAFNLNGIQWLPKSNNSSVRIRPVRTYK